MKKREECQEYTEGGSEERRDNNSEKGRKIRIGGEKVKKGIRKEEDKGERIVKTERKREKKSKEERI